MIEQQIQMAHIRDYTISYAEPLNLLLATFVYDGNDMESDMKTMRDSEDVQRWWRETDPVSVALCPYCLTRS